MITYTEYEAYFLDLATRYHRIAHSEDNNHFAVMDIDDILSAMKSSLNFDTPSMILENPEGKLTYANTGMRDENFGAFLILQQSITRGDVQQRRAVMDLTKSVGMGICGRMLLDKTNRFKGNKTPPRFIEFFDLSQVKYFKVGPIFSNCYGWRFEFNIGQDAPIYYDPADWD